MSAQTDTQSALPTLRRAYDASQRALLKTLEALRQMRETALAEAERSERLAGELRRAEERAHQLERELAEARGEVADLTPLLDADAMTISNLARELAAERAQKESAQRSFDAAMQDFYAERAARQAAEVRDAALRKILTMLGSKLGNIESIDYQHCDPEFRSQLSIDISNSELRAACEALTNPSPTAERITALIDALRYDGTQSANLEQWADWLVKRDGMSERAILPVWLRVVAEAFAALDHPDQPTPPREAQS